MTKTKTNFLSATMLGISPKERAGLIRIMNNFRTNSPSKFVETDQVDIEFNTEIYIDDKLHKLPMQFSMEHSIGIAVKLTTGHPCNTVACIGGHLALMLRPAPAVPVTLTKLSRGEFSLTHNEILQIRQFVSSARHMGALFYPPTDGTVEWSEINTLQAAQAIENFLTTGAPHWVEVMRG